jgi:hypothetical protein
MPHLTRETLVACGDQFYTLPLAAMGVSPTPEILAGIGLSNRIVVDDLAMTAWVTLLAMTGLALRIADRAGEFPPASDEFVREHVEKALISGVDVALKSFLGEPSDG